MLAAEIQTYQFEKLRNSPFTSDFSDEQCHDLSAVLEFCVLEPGDTLLREGEYSDRVYLILSGALAVVKQIGGQDEVLTFMSEGSVAGAMGFVGGQEHSATIRAKVKTELLSLHRDDFESMVNTNPVLVYRAMRALFRSVHGIVRTMNEHYVQLTNYISKQGGRY